MKLKANKPVHGMGMNGSARAPAPLKAGAHMPLRLSSGYSDARGYQGSAARRNGAHTGGLMTSGDTRVRKGPEGNSKGAPPPSLSKPAVSVKAQEGRGAKGRVGKADAFKGMGKKLPESISHSQFEKLGA